MWAELFGFCVLRCYNCGEYGNHVAAKCKLGPMPKRCHHCKSEDHLIAECPHRFNKNNVVIMDEQARDRDHSEKQLASGVAGLSLSEGGSDSKRESNAWERVARWTVFLIEKPFLVNKKKNTNTLATPTPVHEKWGYNVEIIGKLFWIFWGQKNLRISVRVKSIWKENFRGKKWWKC